MPVLPVGVRRAAKRQTTEKTGGELMRKLLSGAIVVILLRRLDYACLVWQNNAAIAAPRQAVSRAALDPGIDWPENSKDTIVTSPNERPDGG
jgi:hypothetical protein